MQRRSFMKAAAATPLLSTALARPSFAQAAAGTLRIVPQANLSALDPMWTTATITGIHGYYVFDTLYGVDSNFRAKPQMAEGHVVLEDGKLYRFKLRSGLKWHDGEPVRAADCVASLQRAMVRDPFGQLVSKVVTEWKVVDDSTFEIRLNRPFPLLIDYIAKPDTPAFMMPERLAKTDANKAITEMVGSGPLRFVASEYNSGSKVVYQKFDGYVPRQEAPDNSSGGKIVNFSRIEWSIITDPATAAAALINGETDWLERPLTDLQPMLARSRDVTLDIMDSAGRLALARMNCLHPPFNDVRLRRAALAAVMQEDVMRATRGDDTTLWNMTRSIWPKNTPYFHEYPDLMPGDINKARAMLKEAGYTNQRTVIISPTDYPDIGPLGVVMADTLSRAGMNIDLQETDWGTVIQRRNNREAVEKGGWSIFHTTGPATFYGSPAMSPLIRGQGPSGWFGWWKSDRAEALTEEWLYATDEATQRKLAAELGRLGLEEVATVPVGQFTNRTAYRKDISGVLKAASPFPWNVKRSA
jgi:peptide/nickel transport system substrate-binding protein